MPKPTLTEQLTEATEHIASLEKDLETLSAENANMKESVSEAAKTIKQIQGENDTLTKMNCDLVDAVDALKDGLAKETERANAAEARLALRAFGDISDGHTGAIDDGSAADEKDILTEWKGKRGTPEEVSFFRANKDAIIKASINKQKGK